MMHPLEARIKKANSENRVAVIPFLTAGYPDRRSFWEALTELDKGGADIIEIGIPFSDPVADGPVVENASREVLKAGVNLDEILAGIKERKDRIKAGLVLMGYINPFLQYGFEKLARDAQAAGIFGLIIPDLPYEEQSEIQQILSDADIALIPLIGLNTSQERMKLYAEKARGYVYVVSVLGITGGKNKMSQLVADTVIRAKETFQIPVALGFGLKHPDQLKDLPTGALPDAAVFGSALLTHLAKGAPVSDFIRPWIN